MVNKNGIEGYVDSLGNGLIVRGILDCNDDIIMRFNSHFEINGGFDSLDISGLYCMYLKGLR